MAQAPMPSCASCEWTARNQAIIPSVSHDPRSTSRAWLQAQHIWRAVERLFSLTAHPETSVIYVNPTALLPVLNNGVSASDKLNAPSR